MKRVGIYSGTFDPVHEGHLEFAREALEKCGLDKVFFLVEPRPRRKQGIKAFEHRAEMVRLAIANKPKFGSVVLEQQRFTPAETLPLLTERFKGAELYMLMGDDMLAHFADWPQVEGLVNHVSFIIGLRRDEEPETIRKIETLQHTRGLSIKYKLFKAGKPEYSSSAIKRDLRHGRPPKGLPPTVLEYIKDIGIYSPNN